MSLIGQVGRRHWRVRLLMGTIYALLLVGSATMIYPFTLMLSTSVTSTADVRGFRLVPRYLYDRGELFRKYLVDRTEVKSLARHYERADWWTVQDIRFEDLRYLERTSDTENRRITDDYQKFIDTASPRERLALFRSTWHFVYSVLGIVPQYQNWLRDKYNNDLAALHKSHQISADSWDDIHAPYEDPDRHAWSPPTHRPGYQDWLAFLDELQSCRFFYVPDMDKWLGWYMRQTYVREDEFTRKTGRPLRSFQGVRMADLLAGELMPAEMAQNILRFEVPAIFYRLHADRARYADFQAQRARTGKSPAIDPDAVPQQCPAQSAALAEWLAYIQQKATPAEIKLANPVDGYRRHLRQEYRTLGALNKAYGTEWTSWEKVNIPYPRIDWFLFCEQEQDIFWRYLTGNYAVVFQFVARHGHALWVTLVYVCLSVLGALTVNPLAAYALSRFRLPYANKILIFLLATMAFPAEVIMIPNFLLVKELHLLNTFAALILPTLGSGFAIFLLKGFFDSLPPELYEAGMLDGASDLRMFRSVTLPLCKPILAVIALGAFTSAYGAFMFALLTCQDPKMWTLMVFLYDFQQSYSLPLIMASLVVSAIPTLIAFLLCQKVILRGIIIPTFK